MIFKSLLCNQSFVFNMNVLFLSAGHKLWQFMLSYAGIRDIWLCTAFYNIAMYNRKGLQVDQTHFIKKVSGVQFGILPESNPEIALSPINGTNRAAVADYDTKVTGMRRGDFLYRWCERDASAAFIAVKDGNIVGYGAALRHTGCHYNLSPVYADDAEIARQLIAKIVRSLPPDSEFVFNANDASERSSIMFKGILSPETIKNGEDTFVLRTSERDLAIDMSKVFLYSQIDTYPI